MEAADPTEMHMEEKEEAKGVKIKTTVRLTNNEEAVPFTTFVHFKFPWNSVKF